MEDKPHRESSSKPKPVPPPKPNAGMSAMTRKLDDLNEKFTQLEEKLNRDQRTSHEKSNFLQTGFNALQKDYFTLREQHGKLQTDNSKLHQELADLKAYLKAFQADHRDVLTEQEKLKTEMNNMRSDQQTQVTDVDKLKTEMNNMRSNQQSQVTDVDKLKTEMNSMRSDQQTQATDVEKLREEQNDILKQVTSVRKEMTSLSQDLNNIKEADIAQLRTEFHNLSQLNQANHDKLPPKMAKIEEDHCKLEKKQISLQTEVTDLQTNQVKLSADVNSITVVQRTLNSDVTRLQSENVDPLLAEQGRLQEEQAALTSDVAMLKADVDQVKTSLQQSLVSSAIAALEKDVDQVKTSLVTLETRLDQVQSPAATPTVTLSLTPAPFPPPNPTTTPTFPPSVDMKKAKPRRLFTSSPKTADDRGTPGISTIVCLPDERLMLTDWNNNKVKVMEVSPRHAVTASLTIAQVPHRLAVLPDGMVAMTTNQPIIYLMTVTDTVTVTSRIETDREYMGIAGHGGGHLLVGCEASFRGLAAVNVLTRKGDLVRTIVDSSRLPGLVSPRHLFDAGDNQVLASDWGTHRVFVVNVTSGLVTLTHQHTDMGRPAQVCSDSAGQLYVASHDGGCVLVRDRTGQWRQLLTARRHSDPGYDRPWGLCLTRSGHLVVSWDSGDMVYSSMVICYNLS